MRRVLFLLVLFGLVCLIPGAPAGADDPDPANHALSGPVMVLWEARYSGPNSYTSNFDGASSIAMSPDGSTVFVTGTSWGDGTANDYATVAYDAATGEETWSARYDGPESGWERALSLAVSPDGSTVFVTGRSQAIWYGDSDYATVAYDAATGEQIWSAHYDASDSRNETAFSLAVSPDGSMVFVTGTSDTLAYDAVTGEEVWVVGSGLAFSLAVSPDGSMVFATGTDATSAYDAVTGEEVWTAQATTAWFESLAVSPDGSTVFVAGTDWLDHYLTVAYHAVTGEQIWSARYSSVNGADCGASAYSLAVSPDGSTVFVAGKENNEDAPGWFATLAYDAATGEQIWFAGAEVWASEDQSASLAVSPDGSTVIVSGSSRPFGEDHPTTAFATFAYDAATGEETWGARYHVPEFYSDRASSIAMSPDGSMVFVTGGSCVVRMFCMYATVAYSPVHTIEINIRRDRINPFGRGVVPVAIYGSEELNVNEIGVTSLRFGPGQSAVAHDLTDPFDFNDHLEDKNLDGHMDLMTHYRVQETGIGCGESEATLSGQTLSGLFFEGTDTFETVGCTSSRPSNRLGVHRLDADRDPQPTNRPVKPRKVE